LIIACPECTSPFEVADGHIAALVQVECPTCNFRMILDFEAANDASLREDGMAMTQGFRDETSYRQAVGAGQVAYSSSAAATSPRGPSLRAVPDQPPVAQPEPLQPPAREPVQPVMPVIERPQVRQPPITPPVEQPPIRQPAQPIEQPVAEQPVIDKPPVRHPQQPTEQPERSRSRPTLIAHTPPPPQPVVTPPQPVAQPTASPPYSEAQVETHVGPPPSGPGGIDVQLDEDVGIDVDMDEPEVAATPAVRTPPHTPVRDPATEPERPADQEARVPQPEPGVTTSKPTGKDREADDEADEVQPKRSRGATALKLVILFLLVATLGLMGWSIATTGTPFQKLLELVGAAQPADDKADKADDASDAKADDKADAKTKANGKAPR
jgi:hypothetical protein